MNGQTRKGGPPRPAYFVATVATPVVFAVLQVLFGSAPVVTIWFGLGMSIVLFLLFRLLLGFSPLGRRRLHFGRSAPLKFWQAPVLWLPVVVVVVTIVFILYIG